MLEATIDAQNFCALQSRQDVARLLEVEDSSLRYFLYGIPEKRRYHTFQIPKRKGGVRTICAPCSELKTLQKKLNTVLKSVYTPKGAAHGFVDQKSILTNAAPHVQKNWVLNVDLKDFFGYVNFGRVRGMLLKPPYALGEEAATVLAQIACFQGKLPQGAPSSPTITNMICNSMDGKLTGLAKRHKAVYSRYADDLTFSTTRSEFPKELAYIDEKGRVILGRSLLSIIEKSGFAVNEDKIFLNHRTSHQEVTGLTVNKFPNIRRSYLANTRAMLHNCEKRGIYEAARRYFDQKHVPLESIGPPEMVEKRFQAVLRGRMQFIRQVKGERSFYYQKYAKQLNSIFETEVVRIDPNAEKGYEGMTKVFISYAWEDEAHRKWAEQFAQRLRGEGVYVDIDRDLPLGKRLPAFMETSIRENDFVLIICTPAYREKSDRRQGGVGYEGNIMTGELYEGAAEEKFIPVLRKGTWSTALPSWMKGKLGVDLSGSVRSDSYEAEYKKLVDELKKFDRLRAPDGGTA